MTFNREEEDKKSPRYKKGPNESEIARVGRSTAKKVLLIAGGEKRYSFPKRKEKEDEVR